MLAVAAPIVKNYISNTGPILVGLAGIALGLLSLAWQAWTHFAVGSRPQLLLSLGHFHALGDRPFVQTYKLRRIEPMVWTGGVPEQVLVATIRNTGRAPTTITNLAMTMGFLTLGPPGEGSEMARQPLPYRLDGESEEHWYFPLENLNHSKGMFPGEDNPTQTDLSVTARVAKRRTDLRASITVPIPLAIEKPAEQHV
jgi:hypothetical protein